MNKKIIFTDRSNELLTKYLKDISKYKILSNEEFKKLIILAQNGDTKAKDTIINSNLRFVVTLAKQYQNRGVPLMDLISSGNLGLCKSVDKYDINKNVVFLSYAAWWIKQCIYNSIYWEGREIRLPVTQQLNLIEIIDATNKFIQQHGRNPSSNELSEELGFTIQQIDHLSQFFNDVKSFDDNVGSDEDNMKLSEIIPDDTVSFEHLLNNSYVKDILENILDNLPIREHDIIKLWYGIGVTNINPKQIANMYGVTKERIRQLKESAILKLNNRFSKTLINLKNDFNTN